MAKATEAQEQIAFIQWTETYVHLIPQLRLWYRIPNGGKRSIRYNKKGEAFCPSGKKSKAMGEKAGLPDLHLPYPSRNFHSLYIEMKVPGGKTSAEQLWWHQALQQVGNRVEVCFSWVHAAKVTLDYLGMSEGCQRFLPSA